jgi:hypothetical protein
MDFDPELDSSLDQDPDPHVHPFLDRSRSWMILNHSPIHAQSRTHALHPFLTHRSHSQTIHATFHSQNILVLKPLSRCSQPFLNPVLPVRVPLSRCSQAFLHHSHYQTTVKSFSNHSHSHTILKPFSAQCYALSCFFFVSPLTPSFFPALLIFVSVASISRALHFSLSHPTFQPQSHLLSLFYPATQFQSMPVS